MKAKSIPVTISSLMILAILATGCGPAAAPTAVSKALDRAPTEATRPALPPSQTPVTSGEQPRYGGVLTAYDSTDAASIDPHQETSMRTQDKMAAVYNRLLMYVQEKLPTRVMTGDLADQWELSKDGMEWTFKLKKGIRFHDGKPLTGRDVKFSLDRLRNPPEGIKKPYQQLYGYIADVQVVNDQTVKLRLVRPTGWLPELLIDVTASIVPEHILSANQKALESRAVGTGPFRVEAWNRGVGFDLVKNREYFKEGLPFLDRIRWLQIGDAGTQFAAFRTGRILYTGPGVRGLSKSEAEILKRELPEVRLHEYSSHTRFELIFNLERKPFDDVKVRQAFMNVIDQQGVIQLAYEGVGYKAWFTRDDFNLPEAELAKLPPYRGVTDADVTRAKGLLQEAGYKEGLTVTFNQGNYPVYAEQQLAISAQLRKIGVQTNIRVLTYPAELVAAGLKKDFLMMHSPTIAPLADPDLLLDMFRSDTPSYYSGLKDSMVDELYSKQTRTVDVTERKQIVHQLVRRLTELVPSVPLLWPRYILGAWPQVRGVPQLLYVKDSWDFEKVWLAK